VDNEAMRRNWTEGAIWWVRNRKTYDAAYAPATAAILVAAGPGPGLRVLDVGCGSGAVLEGAAAAGADVVGVDISPGMAEAARRRVPEATVLVADAQTDRLPGPFDRVVSRFGVMFFADPVAAFGNLRRVAAPDARLVFVCWRTEAENPVFSLGAAPLARRLPPPPPAAPGAPGPAAFADRDRLAGILADAGWQAAIEPFDFVCDYGLDGGDGVEECLTAHLGTLPVRTARRALEAELGEAGWAEVVEEMRAEVRQHLVDGVTRLPAATWLVTAGRRD
jgi:SAM-dependent methyltransferase